MTDIRAGDVVVYVGPGGRQSDGTPHPLRRGWFYRVEAILPADWYGRVGLLIMGKRSIGGGGGFVIHNFRRIDAPRTETSDRIRACRPVKVPA